MSLYVAGLDLGQSQDYTAFVICEIVGTAVKVPYETELLGLPLTQLIQLEVPPITRFNFVHIERFPLGTKYQAIAQAMHDRVQHIPQPRWLAVDQTGVGAGVMEMLAGLNPIGVTITGGNEISMPAPARYRVPKRDLVSALQLPFQNRIAHWPVGMAFVEDLIREMQNFRAKISTNGHDTYEAWREGTHDDLVLAAAIAAWTGDQILKDRLQQVQDALNVAVAAAAKPYEIGQ